MHGNMNVKLKETIFVNGFPFMNKLTSAYVIRLRNLFPRKLGHKAETVPL